MVAWSPCPVATEPGFTSAKTCSSCSMPIKMCLYLSTSDKVFLSRIQTLS
uniref:Uncharacterized protein n=1 Tax=Arundo donax TaxID=35708 RepID=A0A0A9D8N3_ARUDO